MFTICFGQTIEPNTSDA